MKLILALFLGPLSLEFDLLVFMKLYFDANFIELDMPIFSHIIKNTDCSNKILSIQYLNKPLLNSQPTLLHFHINHLRAFKYSKTINFYTINTIN